MPSHIVTFAAALGLLTLVASSAQAAGNAQTGARIFKKCLSCHRIGPGAHTVVGPELNGVVGRKAASLPDYPYSPALKKSGITWDEGTLTKYLHDPRGFIPGVRMTFRGLDRDQDIADVIAYLERFDADGNQKGATSK